DADDWLRLEAAAAQDEALTVRAPLRIVPGEDARQVQRIGRAELDRLRRRTFLAADGEQRQRLGQGELLAREEGHEAPAAHLTTSFEAVQHAQEVAPRWRVGLALQQLTHATALAAAPGTSVRRELALARLGFVPLVRVPTRAKRRREAEQPCLQQPARRASGAARSQPPPSAAGGRTLRSE